jgi:hypothetical protein
MSLKATYKHIADRSLLASQAALDSQIQEKAAFMAYHAFESAGCALADHLGLPVGPKVSHAKKLGHFRIAASRLHHGSSVAALTVTLANLRNRLLYPSDDNITGALVGPDQTITIAQAREIRRRVAGIVRWVGESI